MLKGLKQKSVIGNSAYAYGEEKGIEMVMIMMIWMVEVHGKSGMKESKEVRGLEICGGWGEERDQ